MKFSQLHRFDDDDHAGGDDNSKSCGKAFLDPNYYKRDNDNNNNSSDNSDDDDDDLHLSDIVRHTGDILKRRGLLLEKKAPTTSQFNDNTAIDDVDALHNDNTRQPQFNTQKSINSNDIHSRDSCNVHASTASSPQQQFCSQYHPTQQQTSGNHHYLSKGRRRALRWISDRASQDEERRRKEKNVSSSPLLLPLASSSSSSSLPSTKLANSCSTISTTTASPLPILSTDKKEIDSNNRLGSSIEDKDDSNTIACNAQATIHNKIISQDETTPTTSQRIVQRHHHAVHEPSSSSAMATSQFKSKAIHKEKGNGVTMTMIPASYCTMLPQRNRQPTTATATTIHSSPSSSYSNYHNNISSSNTTLDPNTERLLRFHEAYNAIIRATTLHSNNDDGRGRKSTISAQWLQSGAKRWTRDPNIVSAVSVDGRVYEDLQRTPTLSLKQAMKGGGNKATTTPAAAALHDRAASWFSLVMPPKHSRHHHRRGVVGQREQSKDKLSQQQQQQHQRMQNGNDGNEEDTSASQSHCKILEETMKHKRNVVPIRQFSIDCRVLLGSDGNSKQHANAERGGIIVSMSTLRLLFTGGRHAPVSKPKTRRKKLHQRRNIFDKKSQERVPLDECEMPGYDGRRRALNKSWNYARSVSTVESTNIDSDDIISSTNATEIICPVGNVRAEEEDALSIPPQSPRDRFNVVDFFKESLLYHLSESSIIDTDGTEIDIIDDDVHGGETHNSAMTTPNAKIHSMLMSPSLITKRYQQALKAIEHRNWKIISRMINANPWLMEMKDVRNDQSLVHTLAFFGGELNVIGHYNYSSLENSNPITTTHLPEQLVRDIIEYEPSAVHKLDIEGNLPLHMAAASGNVIMIKELGRRFPGAASVQNHYGLLPLHLALISYNDLLASTTACVISSVESLLVMFPGAVGVKDHDGNFPLHMAVASFRGDDGVKVVNLLQNAYHDWMVANARASNDNPLPPVAGMCKNNVGETPLARAIQSGAGRDMVEALLYGEDGGKLAALEKDLNERNALHLALDRKFHDATIVLSILKASPSTATIVDGDGMLPIQLACRNSLQREVILAISIIDLPIDLGAANGDAVMREGYGASWWYLLCESNDERVDVVHDILSLCSRPQKVALCLAKKLVWNDDTDCDGKHSRSVISCATPRCELELRKRCLFWKRFEIIGEMTMMNNSVMHKFDAVDHGGTQNYKSKVQNEGKRVSLFCYRYEKSYKKDVEHLLLHKGILDSKRFEELCHLSNTKEDDDLGDDSPPHSVSYQYCIVADAPRKTLADVIAQMDSYDRRKYLRKSRLVVHGIAKSLYHLHTNSIIHGFIDPTTIGKFGTTDWKITGLVGSVVSGDHFPASRLGLHSPPEAFVVVQHTSTHERKLVSVAPSLKAEPTVDVWAFGKLLYEVLVGESLFQLFLQNQMKSNGQYNHQDAWKCILKWDEDHHLPKVTKKLMSVGISTTGVDLLLKCLSGKLARTDSMKEIIDHPFWESC